MYHVSAQSVDEHMINVHYHYHVSAQSVDERMINVHYHYYLGLMPDD